MLCLKEVVFGLHLNLLSVYAAHPAEGKLIATPMNWIANFAKIELVSTR